MHEHQNRAAQGPSAAAPTPAGRSPWTFGLRSLLLIVTVVGVLMGVFTYVPKMSFLYLFLLGPPLVIAVAVAVRRRRRGQPMTLSDGVATFAVFALLWMLACWLVGAAINASTHGTLPNAAIVTL